DWSSAVCSSDLIPTSSNVSRMTPTQWPSAADGVEARPSRRAASLVSTLRHQAAASSGPSLASIFPPGNTKSPAANLLAPCRRINRTSNAPDERLRRRTRVAAGTGVTGAGLTDTRQCATMTRPLSCTSWRTDRYERRSATQGKEHHASEADQPDGELRRRRADR